jgi:hypothetical protein
MDDQIDQIIGDDQKLKPLLDSMAHGERRRYA